MHRKLLVHNDQQTLAEIKRGNALLVNKIISVKPVVTTQTSRPK